MPNQSSTAQPAAATRLVVPLAQVGLASIPEVGGKNASLGEMIGSLSSRGVRVPGGFATTAEAYRQFLDANGLAPALDRELGSLDGSDLEALQAAGRACRAMVLASTLPQALVEAILLAYRAMADREGRLPAVAVRSSATAEDLPEASFAGQKPFCMWRGKRPYWRPAGAATPPCSPIGPFPIANTTASATTTWPSRSVCSGWCAPIWPPPA